MMYSIVFGLALLVSVIFIYDSVLNIKHQLKFDTNDWFYLILAIVLWTIYHYMSH